MVCSGLGEAEREEVNSIKVELQQRGNGWVAIVLGRSAPILRPVPDNRERATQMIIGCYSLDLYCDNESRCKNRDQYGLKRAQGNYTGPNGRAAKSDARKDGWRFKGDKVFCNACEQS